jgi:hypothetical protein
MIKLKSILNEKRFIIQEQATEAMAIDGLIKIIKAGKAYYYQLKSSGLNVPVTFIDLAKKIMYYTHPIWKSALETTLADEYINIIKQNIGKPEIRMTLVDDNGDETPVILVKTRPKV